MLHGRVILAIMILPYMAATLRELLLTVPVKVRESAYGVGCDLARGGLVGDPALRAARAPSAR